MSNEVIRETMERLGFSENGIESYLEVKCNFPNLHRNYDEYMGNFGFTEEEVNDPQVMKSILKYMKTHDEYVLLYQDNGYEGKLVYWLTTDY